MASKTNIIVKSAPGVTPERARDVRVRAWRYVFDCYEKHKAAGRSDGKNHETKESKHVSRKPSIHDNN